MPTLIAGLLLFFGLHSISIVAPGWRDGMVRRLGRGRLEKGVVQCAQRRRPDAHDRGLCARPGACSGAVRTARGAALSDFCVDAADTPLLLAAYLPGRIQSRTRHPMLAAIKLWATAHLLAIGALPDVLLFGTFLVWAVFDRISVKATASRGRAASRRRCAIGDLLAVVVGLGLYVLFVLKLHTVLIGVAPLSPPL